MDSGKILYFLRLLNNETEGYGEELADLYKRALDENDDITELKKLLNEYSYYGETGKALYEMGSKLILAVFKEPNSAMDILPDIKQAVISIRNSIKDSEKLMLSPYPIYDSVTALKQKDIIAYINSLKMIANCGIYLIMLYEGLTPLRNFVWSDEDVGIRELIYKVNMEILPELCKIRKPSYNWIIRKKKSLSDSLFSSDSFYITYENKKGVDAQCSHLNKESMGTHSYLNITAYENGECEVPLCWGMGNIISSTPDEALSFLGEERVTKLRAPQGEELKKKLPTPLECVRQLSEGKMFCITPEDMMLAMNQWQKGIEIEERKKVNKCLFCGRDIEDKGLVCSHHFVSE